MALPDAELLGLAGGPQRQLQVEPRALPLLLGNPEAPAVLLDNRPRERKAQPHARRLGRVERFEDVRRLVRGNSEPGIGDLQESAPPSAGVVWIPMSRRRRLVAPTESIDRGKTQPDS